MWIYRCLSRLTLLISLLVLTIIPFYTILSVINIIQNMEIIGILLNLVLLLIEEIGFLFAFYLFYMISGAFSFHSQTPNYLSYPKKLPYFSIIVPSHGKSFLILKETLLGALRLEYDGGYEIIVSDNGQDPEVTNRLRDFCNQHKIHFYHKFDTRGFKAGNINAVLNKTRGELIVILDSDHIPVINLLTEFARVMDDEKIGYIQAKVGYRNTEKLYQAANSILYSQFYEVFEAAKNIRGVVLFNGTTGCFRKNVLLEVNGFSEETLIEDIDTSMKILSKGYKGRYLDFVGSYGLVPETAKAQVAQLWRWAHGACSILRIRLKLIIFSPKLELRKRLELILNAMAFFSGVSIVLLMAVLAIMILGDIPFSRPIFLGFHLGYLMPALIGISYSTAALLAIFWEPREQKLIIRLVQLIPFYLFSLGAFLFLISGVIEGILLKNTPLSENSVWNRQVHAIRDSLLALGFCGLLIIIGLWGIVNNNEFSYFLLGGVSSWILAPLILLYEELFTQKLIKNV
jgi:cellulose synthase/poly-beta-1,6-N-acetylglucosamine synthase-like glycosyltransferase